MTPKLRLRRRVVTILACLLGAVAATAGVWAAFQEARPSHAGAQLAAILPQGALLTIEAKDFAGLLKHWNDSPEKSAWLKSDNYSAFSRSRLFGRLGDAQKEFAQSAGLPPDMSFLNEVAGSESVFAWYDIGKLEFLYITRMPSGGADKTRLMQMRGKFTTRRIGSQTFYVKTEAGSGQEEQSQTSRQARTVAFASSGDWLLLATREDLMAGALTLIATNTGNSATAKSLAVEPWFAGVREVAAKDAGDLRMTLNLEKIVPTPYFRSYWVQQNTTEMKAYRSAVADLYTEADVFREERVLLPKSAQEDGASNPDLGALVALLPQHAGVYRAVAAPNVDAVIGSLDEKLIQRQTGAFSDTRMAPDADVAVHEAGAASDLETRIDAASLTSPANGLGRGAELMPLRQVLATSEADAMMTVSRTHDATDGIWVPFQSALVLSSAKDWDASAMQSAMQRAMQARLTTSGLGLVWKPVKNKGESYFEISDTSPLEMAVRGKLCILADDPGLMQEMLERLSDAKRSRKPVGKSETSAGAEAHPAQATLIAGFNLTEERASFARWSGLVDRTDRMGGTNSGAASQGGEPSFFSQNMRGLGGAFSELESERVVERRDGALTRQTVTYAWRR